MQAFVPGAGLRACRHCPVWASEHPCEFTGEKQGHRWLSNSPRDTERDPRLCPQPLAVVLASRRGIHSIQTHRRAHSTLFRHCAHLLPNVCLVHMPSSFVFQRCPGLRCERALIIGGQVAFQCVAVMNKAVQASRCLSPGGTPAPAFVGTCRRGRGRRAGSAPFLDGFLLCSPQHVNHMRLHQPCAASPSPHRLVSRSEGRIWPLTVVWTLQSWTVFPVGDHR